MTAARSVRSVGRPTNPIARTEILDVATSAFAELGFAGASMEEIANRVGIRKSSLFHHVGSKEALYQEVFDRLVVDLGSIVAGAGLDDPEATWLDRLDRLSVAVPRYLGASPAAARLLVREFLDRAPRLPATSAAGVLAVLEATAAFLDAGMELGVIARADPRHLALSIAGLHLLYFATHDLSSRLIGVDVFSPGAIADREREVQGEVRRLVGAAA